MSKKDDTKKSLESNKNKGPSEDDKFSLDLRNLSIKQIKALPIIYFSKSDAEAARKLQVSIRNIYRWKEQEEFVEALYHFAYMQLEAEMGEINSLEAEARKNLKELLKNGSDPIKFRCIKLISDDSNRRKDNFMNHKAFIAQRKRINSYLNSRYIDEFDKFLSERSINSYKTLLDRINFVLKENGLTGYYLDFGYLAFDFDNPKGYLNASYIDPTKLDVYRKIKSDEAARTAISEIIELIEIDYDLNEIID